MNFTEPDFVRIPAPLPEGAPKVYDEEYVKSLRSSEAAARIRARDAEQAADEAAMESVNVARRVAQEHLLELILSGEQSSDSILRLAQAFVLLGSNR